MLVILWSDCRWTSIQCSGPGRYRSAAVPIGCPTVRANCTASMPPSPLADPHRRHTTATRKAPSDVNRPRGRPLQMRRPPTRRSRTRSHTRSEASTAGGRRPSQPPSPVTVFPRSRPTDAVPLPIPALGARGAAPAPRCRARRRATPHDRRRRAPTAWPPRARAGGAVALGTAGRGGDGGSGGGRGSGGSPPYGIGHRHAGGGSGASTP